MLDDSPAKPLTAGRCIHAGGVELGRAGSEEAAEDFRKIVGLSKPQRLAISLTGRSEWLESSLAARRTRSCSTKAAGGSPSLAANMREKQNFAVGRDRVGRPEGAEARSFRV